MPLQGAAKRRIEAQLLLARSNVGKAEQLLNNRERYTVACVMENKTMSVLYIEEKGHTPDRRYIAGDLLSQAHPITS